MFEKIKGLFSSKKIDEVDKSIPDYLSKLPLITSTGDNSNLIDGDMYEYAKSAKARKMFTSTDEWKSIPSISSAVNIIKDFVGTREWVMYYKTSDTNDTIIDDSEPYLHALKHPGHGLSGASFKKCLIESYLTKGAFAFFIERDSSGVPVSLSILNVQGLTEASSDRIILDSVQDVGLFFKYNGVFNGKYINTLLAKKDVVLSINYDSSGYSMYSKLESLALDKGVYVGSKIFQKEYFDNGANPGTYIKCEEEPGEAELLRMENTFASKFGRGNRHKPMIGSGEISIVGNGMKDIDISALNTDLARDTSYALGVPSSMLGFTSNSNRATIEKEEQNFREYTISPLLKMLDSEITDKYLYEAYAGLVYLEHDDVTISSTLDNTEKASKILASIGKIYTVNEARKAVGLDRIDDEKYDTLDIDSDTLDKIQQLLNN